MFVFDSHSLWLYVHILLLVYWLGADVGLYMVMVYVKNPELSYETRETLIKLAFHIDQFPRVCFALMLPVGLHLAKDMSLITVSPFLFFLAWIISIFWSFVHLAIVKFKDKSFVRCLARFNQLFELLMGGFFVTLGVKSLITGIPITADWFALKILLFGLIYWVILGIDTIFQPFTTILNMGPEGSTAEKEASITRSTNLTMMWAVLLYLLILSVAFLGKVKF